MPNIYGLYNLAELRDYTRRCMNAIQAVVSPTTGEEAAPLLLDPLFSNVDINLQLNSGLVSIHADMVAANENAFQDEEYIDIEADRVEYPLPPDLMQLRELGWKDASTAYTFSPPTSYTFMHKIDEPEGLFGAALNGAPTYRLGLGRFYINESDYVKRANAKGVKIRYIKWPQPLTLNEDYLETQFARLVQEVLVRRAAIELIELRTKLDASSMKAERDAWNGRLVLAVRDSFRPSTVQFIGKHPLENKMGTPR